MRGLAWPGYQPRMCPVCRRGAGTHREPVSDRRVEVVVFHTHYDGSGQACAMSGHQAALAAVAFTGTAVA